VKLQNDTWSADWVKLGTIYRLAEVPLLVKLRLSDKLAVMSGPMLMYRFIPPKAILIGPSDRESDPIVDDSFYKELAFAVIGGIEFRLSEEVVVDIRYNYNLTSFDDYGSPWENDTVFRGIIAGMGLLF
jgi:opacity protein-like surface antigen